MEGIRNGSGISLLSFPISSTVGYLVHSDAH
jgi:hypothetical protein